VTSTDVSVTRVHVLAPPDFRALELLRDAGVESVPVQEAEAILVAPRSASQLRDLLPMAKNVRWIHTLAAGVESLPFDLLRNSAITVTNSRGLYADALGEFVMAAMLWFAKDLRRLVRNQAARKWEPFDVEWLQGKTVAVIGYGGIGSAIGRRAEAMGMNVLPVRRSAGDVDDVIAKSDYVVLSTPLTPATRGLMNAARIGKLQSQAVLINVSRGAIVDERALIDALREKRIRGAALDVFETEPLPPDHPLWDLDNVLISPHSADHTSDAHERAMRFFLENLGRYERGEKLGNIVDRDAGY
jgi:phosphoglycerate dehydrogenase-like enzyme